jgi:hypothetical protein
MAYLKPPAFVRKVFNPLAMRFGLAGTRPLTVRRRRSGGAQRVPVIPVSVDGVQYVVSSRGESEWVRNLRAAGTGSLGDGKGGDQAFRATEIPVGERAPIIAVYRKAAGRTVAPYWKKLPDDADHPVFRINPV